MTLTPKQKMLIITLSTAIGVGIINWHVTDDVVLFLTVVIGLTIIIDAGHRIFGASNVHL